MCPPVDVVCCAPLFQTFGDALWTITLRFPPCIVRVYRRGSGSANYLEATFGDVIARKIVVGMSYLIYTESQAYDYVKVVAVFEDKTRRCFPWSVAVLDYKTCVREATSFLLLSFALLSSSSLFFFLIHHHNLCLLFRLLLTPTDVLACTYLIQAT